uniref:Uncharacterized protein n=1 Tax=Aegilops tauschii subsp. strangulata TaxID=200361 RepID=A0A453E812_AEGTS
DGFIVYNTWHNNHQSHSILISSHNINIVCKDNFSNKCKDCFGSATKLPINL